MDSDSDCDGPGFDEGAMFDYWRECKEFGCDVNFSPTDEDIAHHELEVERVRVAYDEVRAAPRVVCRATKRRRIDGPSCRTLPSLGVGPLAAAFSFLHPVELVRMEMTAKAVREPVDVAWRSMFKRLVRRPGRQRWELSSLVPRNVEEYGIAECRRAVILEEGHLCFCSDLDELFCMAGNPFPLFPWPPHEFPPGSLSDLILKRFIFVRQQCRDLSRPFPSECECGEVNSAWKQLFPDRPLRCRRCREFDLALECIDMATDVIGSETEVDRDEALLIALWEKDHGVG
jgi:hypothetical protein